jgi:hypothetical protein
MLSAPRAPTLSWLAAVAAMLGAIAIAAGCGSGASSSGPPADGGAPHDGAGLADVTVDAGSDSPSTDAAVSDAPQDAAPSDSSAACPNLPDVTLVDPTSTPLLSIQGDPGSQLGIYDPSLVYPKGASGGVLSYSIVGIGDAGQGGTVNTRVAASADLGATFQYVAEPNTVTPVTVSTTDTGFCDAGACSVEGVLWHEVSSIVADPGDPAAPFKLFVHSYVSVPGGPLRRDWGYIGMQTATTPSAWSSEQKLLGWQSDATISTAGVTQVLTNLPELKDCLVFTEPGAIVGPQGLDLALSCGSSPSPGVLEFRVVLIRSTDHAHSFTFVSTLVSANDFACLDGTVPWILGADLFTVGAAEYLVVSPSGPVSNDDGGGYRACVTIPVADPTLGTIARASNGAPEVVSWVASSDGRFTGPCTYAEGATALGQVVPMQYSVQDLPLFRILRTTIPEP